MSINELLAAIDDCPRSIPLVALDQGRPGTPPTPSASFFSTCRMPDEARSAWLLYAGFGTQSHSISQDAHTTEGSYLHGIYHRMEPDDWNSKYWFRQVGQHPIAATLAEQASAAGYNTTGNWDHARFVDFHKAARAGTHVQLAETVQWLEWRLLFEYCVKDFSR